MSTVICQLSDTCYIKDQSINRSINHLYTKCPSPVHTNISDVDKLKKTHQERAGRSEPRCLLNVRLATWR